MTDTATRWAAELAAWAVPDHILDAAPQTLWVFPPEMFSAPEPGSTPRSGATEIAAAAIPDGGTVLDVGCGGGAAGFALVPPATALIGTDRQRDMVDAFAATAAQRGIPATVVAGAWPAIAAEVPSADVAVSHNVLYNVPDIASFAVALNDHARRRVVIEITERHPQVTRAPLWKRFWDLERPDGPSAWLAAEVLAEVGFDVTAERTAATPRDTRRAGPVEAAFWCRQLCLPIDRVDEVAAAVADLEFPTERVTLWWDVS